MGVEDVDDLGFGMTKSIFSRLFAGSGWGIVQR
jgi:hypothetical protein